MTTPPPPDHSTFVTLRIPAPQARFVLVSGQAYVQPFDSVTRTLYVRVRNTGNGESSPIVKTFTALNGETIGLSWVFPVAAGPQTFVLEAYASDTSRSLGSATLTCLYIPLGSTSASTLEVAEP